ncbi:cell envelope integrity protein TolA [Ktedonobacter racemifer]|uniref:Uncharacterized protein n=1 Tax=Ktedonobacter racemifer DSM 44963 TaxID=485913 RepID=D6TKU5_KTERA|nr:cell envelope integrity protein TolA [Ktedonobacter racemifer]EFH86395.1 hypothetical protein Krac_7690 [Ktedonobacter racemifer DSM 44963]
MDKIPFEEQRVIYELVEFWKTGEEPRDLIIHIDRLSGSWGSGLGVNIFRKVYADLRANNHRKHGAELQQFLESEYLRLAEIHAEQQARAREKAEAAHKAQQRANAERRAQQRAEAERRAQVEAEEHAKRKQNARANFEALGKEMEETTDRAELVRLGIERAHWALYTGIRYDYESHCWHCTHHISSAIQAQCPVCTYYICSNCGSCFCDRDKRIGL